MAAMHIFQDVLERVLPDSADRKGSKTGGAGTRDSQPEVARSGTGTFRRDPDSRSRQ